MRREYRTVCLQEWGLNSDMISNKAKLVLATTAAMAGLAIANTTQFETTASAATVQGSGYLNDGTGWYWFENGQRYTGFRFYMGSYYWFQDGVRQENSWESAWGMSYYVGADGRAVQGVSEINGVNYDFGNNGTFFSRGKANGYVATPSGWLWMQNGYRYTGFQFYMGTYYWFKNGARIQNSWENAWGMTYYVDNVGRAVQGLQTIGGKQYFFGNDGTFFLRKNTKFTANGANYSADANGVVTKLSSGSVKDQMMGFAQAWHGWDSTQQYYLDLLINYESGWNVNARNGQYVGLFQTTGIYDMSVEGQAKVGLAYIANRYGNPQGAWNHIQAIGWY